MVLLNAFNSLSQERRDSKGVPLTILDRDIREYQQYNGSGSVPSDLFMMAIKSIDSDFISKRYDEIRKENKGS